MIAGSSADAVFPSPIREATRDRAIRFFRLLDTFFWFYKYVYPEIVRYLLIS